MQMIKQPE